MSRPAEEIARALAATDDEGRLRFPLVDVEDFLAVLILSFPPEERGLDEESTLLLGRFAARAGVNGMLAPEDAMASVEAYLVAHPLDPHILEAAARVAREHLSRGGVAGDLLARFTAEKRSGGVLGGGKRPEGTVPAGPLARFLVDTKKSPPR